MANKHSLEKTLRILGKKKDIKIENLKIYILTDKIWDNKEAKSINNPFKHFDIGNKSWGKIDYLVENHSYSLIKVGKFPKL